MDSASGEVTVAVSADSDQTLLDAESSTSAQLYMMVVATDPVSHHSTASMLTIVLRDANDCSPMFVNSQRYVGVIAENSLTFTQRVHVQVQCTANYGPT